jgi:hypothetical protein
LGLWAILSLTLSMGLVIFTKYQTCDPIEIKANNISKSEEVFNSPMIKKHQRK